MTSLPCPPPPLLPHRLEKHELMEFRRIAAFIYKRNLKWRKAVALAKTDKLYKDAMETAAQVGGARRRRLVCVWGGVGLGRQGGMQLGGTPGREAAADLPRRSGALTPLARPSNRALPSDDNTPPCVAPPPPSLFAAERRPRDCRGPAALLCGGGPARVLRRLPLHLLRPHQARRWVGEGVLGGRQIHICGSRPALSVAGGGRMLLRAGFFAPHPHPHTPHTPCFVAVALEVAWTNGLMDSIMPFLIQTLK